MVLEEEIEMLLKLLQICPHKTLPIFKRENIGLGVWLKW
jgi:hypothetical protein